MTKSKLPSSVDARDWAKEFCQIAATKGLTVDEDWMGTWFANAIMAGYDYARNEIKHETTQHQHPARPEL